MKNTLIAILLLFSTVVQAQLNNSWINYNNTYYKFRLGQNGICRINQPTLASAGLSNVSAEQFQLWRNGQQVPIYTSVPTGIFGTNDYIEFLGKANDGVPDNTLYLSPSYQLCDSISLFTDTVSYFLTVNSAGGNSRFNNAVNDIADNTLQPDAYFMRRVENPYKQQVNPGYFVNLGENIYSSAYDIGEGWTSGGVNTCCTLAQQFNNLNVYTSGPPNSVSLYISAVGVSTDRRNFYTKIFNTMVIDTPMNYLASLSIQQNNLPLSLLQSSSYVPVYMGLQDTGNNSANDFMVVATVALTYPATFNFNNQQNFYFELAPSVNGDYLQINNFNNNGVLPVLYDLNTGNRYTGNISTPGMVQFALPASTDNVRKFMLVSEDPSNITVINTLTSRNFINYSLAANQGNYIIISNPVLYNDGTGINNVEKYREYRSSAAGGGYNAITISIDELTDQFGFGIKKHPTAIRDFIRSTQSWTVKPQYVFLIGRGMTSLEYRTNESTLAAQQLDLVQSFGYPASDILLACNPGQNVPLVPIGRLPVINGAEIAGYLQKMQEYETQQASTSNLIEDKAWMKNFLQVSGGSDATESAEFTTYLNNYGAIAADTLMGASVQTFAKSSSAYIQQLDGAAVTQLINGGLGFIGYFGHASANIFAFNLSAPSEYTNKGRYPFFNVSGCIAGNTYTYDPTRLNTPANLSISESWVLTPESGAIGFEADTHFGIPYYLDQYNTSFYNEFSNDLYGNTVGNQLKKVLQTLNNNYLSNEGFFLRIHMEEINLDGDPALKINNFALPDYAIEQPMVKLNPSIISVANSNFTVNITIQNIGKAVNDSVTVLVERKLPNGTLQILYDQQRPPINNTDSLNFTVPINPVTDKGANEIIVEIDPNDKIAELSKLNNNITVNFTIYEDELIPVYPYNYSIINQQNITYSASTANPLSGQRQYLMEVDTTALFNSPFKKQYTASGLGGIVQFTPPNITFTDSTVYYWHTAMVPLVSTTPLIWNTFSFVYLPQSSSGFNQSHYYQHLNSSYTNISLDSDRVFRFAKIKRNLIIQTGLYPYFSWDKIDEFLDNVELDYYGCNYNSIQVMVYDSTTLQPWSNYNVNGAGRFGSLPVCNGPRDFFEFSYGNPIYRKQLMNFLLDSIPNGMYVSIANLGVDSNNDYIAPNTSFINSWQADTATLGSGNSLYNTLKSIGFTKIDSFTHNLPFLYFYRKNNSSFSPVQSMGPYASSYISDTFPLLSRVDSGVITSPLFGPASAWTSLHWYGKSVDPLPVDNVRIQVYGVLADGVTKTLLTTVSPATDTSLSFINAAQYPYLQLAMLNKDTVYLTPNQLDYWRINASYVPEGAVAPSILYNMLDTVSQGQKIPFVLAFKNISPVAFDSLMSTKFTITNATTNKTDTFAIPKGKILIAGDTLVIRDSINTANYPGNNLLYVMVNPYNDQPEQYFFNNSINQNFYVKPNNYDPLLDVTFDGVHILNDDLVSAKPKIVIKLTDASQYLPLSDTSLVKVQVFFPDPTGGNGTLITYHFGDSMQFIPANLTSGQNTATINLTGNFPVDGQYELIVSGKDVSGNPTGNLEYRVAFNVINKTMISNLFNYPNPFTTSTAFVFTLTGSELPQNMRIQILTITGKVVKEITQAELGPLHIGDNITEYKWDGTDMYGQKLANGVYLYRVLTNLNGKSIEKYNGTNANGEVISSGLNKTQIYFTKGYGKMYLMR